MFSLTLLKSKLDYLYLCDRIPCMPANIILSNSFALYSNHPYTVFFIWEICCYTFAYNIFTFRKMLLNNLSDLEYPVNSRTQNLLKLRLYLLKNTTLVYIFKSLNIVPHWSINFCNWVHCFHRIYENMKGIYSE